MGVCFPALHSLLRNQWGGGEVEVIQYKNAIKLERSRISRSSPAKFAETPAFYPSLVTLVQTHSGHAPGPMAALLSALKESALQELQLVRPRMSHT